MRYNLRPSTTVRTSCSHVCYSISCYSNESLRHPLHTQLEYRRLHTSYFFLLDRVLRHSKSQCRVLSAVFENASSSGNAVTSACGRCHSPSRIVCGFSWNSFVGAGRHDGHTAACCCAASVIPAAAAPLPILTGHTH